jgi:hypothetical protein
MKLLQGLSPSVMLVAAMTLTNLGEQRMNSLTSQKAVDNLLTIWFAVVSYLTGLLPKNPKPLITVMNKTNGGVIQVMKFFGSCSLRRVNCLLRLLPGRT